MILELREKSGRKYSLFLDGEKYCRCYPGDLRRLGFDEFSEGQSAEVSAEEAAAFEQEVLLPRAKRRTLMLLGKKEYTVRELRKKMAVDGYPETVTETVLVWLGSLRYVDDRSYAERYAFSLLSRHSERLIVQKMQQKGFEKDIIKEALEGAKERYREEYSSSEEQDGEKAGSVSPEQDAIRCFLRKKGYQAEVADEEKKKKLMMSLYRKGYLMSDIRAVMGECDGMYDF